MNGLRSVLNTVEPIIGGHDPADDLAALVTVLRALDADARAELLRDAERLARASHWITAAIACAAVEDA